MVGRKRGPSQPLADPFDYVRAAPDGPPAPAHGAIVVTDDWGAAVPVSDREARIIEAFFADVLDELFGPIP